MEDICAKIEIGQFGGQAGIGTEHLIVCLLDRILQLLDKNTDGVQALSHPSTSQLPD